MENLERDNIKPKKFVFQIDSENAEYVENLPANQRNVLINQLLNGHVKYNYTKKLNQNFIKPYKQFGAAILALIIGIPLFILLLNFSLSVTINSYSVMQQNFTKLFEEKGITK